LADLAEEMASQRQQLQASGDRRGLDEWRRRIVVAAEAARVTPCLASGCQAKATPV
jgi:hypothetical protein